MSDVAQASTTKRWSTPAFRVVALRSTSIGERSYTASNEPQFPVPPIIAKDTGATDAGGKGYGKPKTSGSSDFGVKDWP